MIKHCLQSEALLNHFLLDCFQVIDRNDYALSFLSKTYSTFVVLWSKLFSTFTTWLWDSLSPRPVFLFEHQHLYEASYFLFCFLGHGFIQKRDLGKVFRAMNMLRLFAEHAYISSNQASVKYEHVFICYISSHQCTCLSLRANLQFQKVWACTADFAWNLEVKVAQWGGLQNIINNSWNEKWLFCAHLESFFFAALLHYNHRSYQKELLVSILFWNNLISSKSYWVFRGRHCCSKHRLHT